MIFFFTFIYFYFLPDAKPAKLDSVCYRHPPPIPALVRNVPHTSFFRLRPRFWFTLNPLYSMEGPPTQLLAHCPFYHMMTFFFQDLVRPIMESCSKSWIPPLINSKYSKWKAFLQWTWIYHSRQNSFFN